MHLPALQQKQKLPQVTGPPRFIGLSHRQEAGKVQGGDLGLLQTELTPHCSYFFLQPPANSLSGCRTAAVGRCFKFRVWI